MQNIVQQLLGLLGPLLLLGMLAMAANWIIYHGKDPGWPFTAILGWLVRLPGVCGGKFAHGLGKAATATWRKAWNTHTSWWATVPLAIASVVLWVLSGLCAGAASLVSPAKKK